MTYTAEIIGRNLAQGRDVNLAGLYKAWERVGQALRHVRGSPRAIVDVGCCDATGTALFGIAHPRARLIGVECVPERAEMSRRVCSEVHQCFFQDAPILTESVDLVFAGEVIEHVTEEDARSFVATASRVLRRGGTLILTTPNPHYLRLWLTGRSVLDEPAHLSQWSARRLSRLVCQHGFKVRRVEGTGKVSRKIGTVWPIAPIYGSYMLIADRI